MHPPPRYKAMTATDKLAAMRTSITSRAASALALVVLAGIAGCAGDAPPDIEHSCTGELYDSCLQEHECTSNNCRSFAADGIQVCTMTCTAGDDSTCPKTADGKTVTCNQMGICKPPAANNCTRP
jgi:hypothetical protein